MEKDKVEGGKMYYVNLSDEEIQKKVERLPSFQRKVLDRLLVEGADLRTALFVASSYPMVIEDQV